MTAMELQQWKKNFVEDYLDEIDDLEVLEKIKKYVKRVMPKKENPRPCVVHSQEEMIAAIRESEEAIERGEYITDEELSEEIKTWWK
ncbi:hypothetical protein [Parabacteroides gordonii]|uniref:Uncharacterized protein n=1 Tax=Parabacteroides gordonii MS-1 = DSM 23371 TaxID=1203610 RepID=A0A0F5IPJ9_9BACT|nr:hypothetical protein [Parabacteroides gordonii]KKB47499.1 hypothetical protein HMPREF1536_05143 [Parabacteroides gordonii MS-1 = DSM 23371]MCA5584589.1 hypothetical protein [Parabacteroides gordonii]